MLDYYCYVYFNDKWEPYYVGKGFKRRATYRNDSVPVPASDHIQYFYFAEAWQAFECEIELIALWQRKQDGGLLVNQTLGGLGTRGLVCTPESRTKRSASRKALPHLASIILKCNEATRTPISLTHVTTQEQRDFISVHEAARQLDLNPSHISAMRSGRRKTHGGWRLT